MENYNLHIELEGPMRDFGHIKVYNGHQQIVAKGYGTLSCNLVKGIYQIEAEINEETKTEFISLSENLSKFIELPQTDSSFLGDSFNSSHEYYTYSAIDWSKKPTVSYKTKKANSSVFIFFRYPSQHIFNKFKSTTGLGENFSMLDVHRERIYSLSNQNIEEDREFGWLAFHVALSAGQYYLVYTGAQPREIPIYLFEGWQTQLFLTFRYEPLFQSLKMSIERPHLGYNPFGDKQQIDLSINAISQKLHNGIYYLPDELLEKIAYNKWDNPMLAFLGLNVYLRSERNDKNSLFQTILTNLKQEILYNDSSPDIMALEIMSAIHNKKAIPDYQISNPCMMLSGMHSLIQASHLQETVIKPNSLLESCLDRIYSDLIWTSYKPLNISLDSVINDTEEWVGQTIIDKLNTNIHKGKEEIADPLSLAIELNITTNLVNKSIKKILRIGKELESPGAEQHRSFKKRKSLYREEGNNPLLQGTTKLFVKSIFEQSTTKIKTQIIENLETLSKKLDQHSPKKLE